MMRPPRSKYDHQSMQEFAPFPMIVCGENAVWASGNDMIIFKMTRSLVGLWAPGNKINAAP